MSFGTRSGRPGFFDRAKTGWALTKDSAGVIRDHPNLLVFPLIAGVASAAFLVVLFVPMLIANLIGSGLEYVALFVVYFATTFVSTYAAAALVHATNEAFHGREPNVIASLKTVRSRLGPIVVWSLISATISVVLKTMEDSDNPIAGILRSLFAVGWSIMTFFIVPVIVFEDVSVTSMFSKSASAFRDTWGETLGAGFGITLVVTLVGIVLAIGAIAVSVPVAAVFPGPGILLALLLLGGVIAFAYLLSQTIWGVAKTALYVYAVEGHRPAEFDNFDFETLGGRTEESASPGTAGSRDTLDL
ncbi:hypothetical protein J2751_000966 [Halorubrum alkaliphilum]|uniref:Glycerophosphoryl diester phosphodiesterase membrane domain-containing protein n=1 Tax=Halorubrum alkaliphilum TaxID=261290 RepID=A0A8T4GES6_9EURY|nr:DUF6159 family protein [Halorubrum alkaliphilum]MBP1921961.1 hypothetical protein [Halorubrum alkaliphilum]